MVGLGIYLIPRTPNTLTVSPSHPCFNLIARSLLSGLCLSTLQSVKDARVSYTALVHTVRIQIQRPCPLPSTYRNLMQWPMFRHSRFLPLYAASVEAHIRMQGIMCATDRPRSTLRALGSQLTYFHFYLFILIFIYLYPNFLNLVDLHGVGLSMDGWDGARARLGARRYVYTAYHKYIRVYENSRMHRIESFTHPLY